MLLQLPVDAWFTFVSILHTAVYARATSLIQVWWSCMKAYRYWALTYRYWATSARQTLCNYRPQAACDVACLARWYWCYCHRLVNPQPGSAATAPCKQRNINSMLDIHRRLVQLVAQWTTVKQSRYRPMFLQFSMPPLFNRERRGLSSKCAH